MAILSLFFHIFEWFQASYQDNLNAIEMMFKLLYRNIMSTYGWKEKLRNNLLI